MPIRHKTVWGFVGGVVDKVFVLIGFSLLIFAVSSFSQAYQWEFALGLPLGVFLIMVGIVLHFEVFTLKIPSREGYGTILLCVSVLFMAGAVIAAFFAVPGESYAFPTSDKPGAKWITVLQLERPNAWLAPILFGLGVGLLILGFVLRSFRDIF